MTALHVDLTGCHEIHATIRASNFKEIVILDKIKQAISYIIRLIQFCICFTDLIMIFFLSNRFNFTSIEIHSLYVIQVETCRLVYRWSLSIGGRARASNSVAAAGPADSRVFRDARLERELKSNAPWGERRWLATRLDSTRLRSTPLDSTRLDSARAEPPAATLSVAAPRAFYVSTAAAPRIRDLIYTNVAQVYVCMDVSIAEDAPYSPSHLSASSYVVPLFPFFDSSSSRFYGRFLSLALVTSISRWLFRSVRSPSRANTASWIRPCIGGISAPSLDREETAVSSLDNMLAIFGIRCRVRITLHYCFIISFKRTKCKIEIMRKYNSTWWFLL